MRPRSVLGLQAEHAGGAVIALDPPGRLVEHAADVRPLDLLERAVARSAPRAAGSAGAERAARRASSSPPCDMMSARSTTFSSSRTLPGQS